MIRVAAIDGDSAKELQSVISASVAGAGLVDQRLLGQPQDGEISN